MYSHLHCIMTTVNLILPINTLVRYATNLAYWLSLSTICLLYLPFCPHFPQLLIPLSLLPPMLCLHFPPHPSAGATVYDVTKRSSFASVRRWMDEVRRYTTPNVAVVLIGERVPWPSC